MKWKKKEKETKPNKVKKVRTMKVGTHKKSVIALWLVLIASVSFGVYKNFTAIDMHTVHEKKIIEERIVDTNKIENGAIPKKRLTHGQPPSAATSQRACRI